MSTEEIDNNKCDTPTAAAENADKTIASALMKPEDNQLSAETHKTETPLPAVFSYREDLGNDPFRGIIKWAFLEGVESGTKKDLKPEFLHKLLIREVARTTPDRYLVMKIVDRMIKNPKESKSKDFCKSLSESTRKATISVPETLARLDMALPSEMTRAFKAVVSDGWKSAMKKQFSPDELSSIDNWIRDRSSMISPSSNLEYLSAKARMETLHAELDDTNTRVANMKQSILEASEIASRTSRVLINLQNERMAPLLRGLDGFKSEIEMLRETFRKKEQDLSEVRANAMEMASVLRNEIATIRAEAEREKEQREEAEQKRKAAEHERDERATDLRFERRDREAERNRIGDSIRPYYDDFRLADRKDSEMMSQVFRGHLSRMFTILQRLGISLKDQEELAK